ncbi:MAG: succinate dehydrogenase hydrophobic membrane anchor subunit [Actinomycetota bacterium]
MNVQDAYLNRFHPDSAPSRKQVWSWFFMRISGLGLVFLVLGHMAIMHVIGGGVDRIDYDFVAARWTGLFWRSYDWLLLALALTHGAIGARGAIQDHLRRPRLRRIATVALWALVAFMMVLGTFVLATFEVAGAP